MISPGDVMNMKIPTLSCKRCLHTWFPRHVELPVKCPKCQSPYWNKERIKRKAKPKEA